MEKVSEVKDDDWESLADSGELDIKIRELSEANELNSRQMTAGDSEIPNQPVMQFKILKKSPIQAATRDLHNESDKLNQRTASIDTRTFEQREEDYMRARQRIFGTTEDGKLGANAAGSTERPNTNENNFPGFQPKQSVPPPMQLLQQPSVSSRVTVEQNQNHLLMQNGGNPPVVYAHPVRPQQPQMFNPMYKPASLPHHNQPQQPQYYSQNPSSVKPRKR